MPHQFYPPGAQRAEKVQDLFGRIARRYDLINDLQSFGLHRLWKRQVVRLARVGPGQRALDVCCGTGDLAFGLARAGADVTGMDFSPDMLAVARQRAEAATAPLPRHFLQGDGLNLAFPDNTFDAVTVGYGLRNLGSWERGLEEMWRVAKPGGRLVVLECGKPDNPLWRKLYFAYLRWFVPLFGKLFCGDRELYGYILESLEKYPAQHGVAEKMRQLNCANVTIINLLGGVMTINCGEKQTGPDTRPALTFI